MGLFGHGFGERDNALTDGRSAPSHCWHVDMVADIENHMRRQSGHGTTMIALRCGHFAGERYNLGLLSLLLLRLKTHLVP